MLDILFPASTSMESNHSAGIYSARITWGKWSSTELFSRGFFHIPKELKRNMECLETAVISQEGGKGGIQFASRLPKIIKGGKKGASDSEQNFCPEIKIVHMAYIFLVLQEPEHSEVQERERDFKIT